ncbi:class I SAM-dependent methyltransferase [Salinispora tropica]|uniref:class I SAM-dependent methyltransferase n=1 Tax=Salinispora tropica TaxID=168695 RepID=UPI00048E0EAC|nr:class I SAM-dependent methyltransferase [Salinispora tropica]
MGRSCIAELLLSFAAAPAKDSFEEYQQLTAALWRDGELTELAHGAVSTVVDCLDEVADSHKGYLAILLGLLAEADPSPHGEVVAGVRKGLDRYLDLLARQPSGQPLALALLYLVGHFPEARDQIMSSVAGHRLAEDDLTRLTRVLQPLDADDVVLGRVWPSPAEWTLSEAEREHDRTWIARLSPEQVAATYAGDTLMLLGYSGAKAYWALQNGVPGRAASPDPYGDAAPENPPPFAPETIQRHTSALRCPTCHSRLIVADDVVTCTGCESQFSTAHGVLDLTGALAESGDPDDVLRNAAVQRRIGLFYENVLRPGFLRLMGSNWSNQIMPWHEDAYLVENTRPVDGPVLDLAAGAGRWTAVLTNALDGGRMIALDLNPVMLTWLRGRLPEVAAVRASALDLPFGEATLGAVNCWNALQALPDPASAITEIGRCLRPGGSFTLLTFRSSDDPIYRYFQNSFRGPGFPDGGMPLFRLEDIRTWLDQAGLTVRAESVPGTFILVTAERR